VRRSTVRIVALALTLALLAACGGGDEVVTSDDPRPSNPAPADQRYTATATVLESPEHGPQLCSGVRDSYPPQCGGPDIVGWDWDDVPAKESANGTTWGAYTVVGTWDGTTLTLTEPPTEPRREVEDELGDRMTYRAIDEVTGRVEVGVHADDGLQARFDERYGEGVVLVGAMLRPLEG